MARTATRSKEQLYRLAWRWHFYAGLCVAPFLVILSITGIIYLFNDELNDLIYPDLRLVEQTGRTSRPMQEAMPDVLQAIAIAYPDSEITRIYTPLSPERTLELFVTTAEGAQIRAFVNPETVEVLGDYVYTKTLVGWADVMHGSLMMGDVGDAIVELAACWTLVMLVTGIYLWLSSRSASAKSSVTRKGRSLWRHWHKLTGIISAFFILFLIVSGLPWATVWGGKILQPVSDALGAGYPVGARSALQSGNAGHHHSDIPWTLRQAPPATSLPADKHPLAVGKVMDILNQHGMNGAYRLFLPSSPEAAYMAYTYPDQPEGQRTLHIDQYSGEVSGDVTFSDYGAVAKAVEWGVALHMGNYFGRLNQIIMLLTCLAIMALTFSGIVMWWKRKPPQRLGAPRVRGVKLPKSWVLGIMMLGVLMPLFGLSVLVVWLIDALWSKTRTGHVAADKQI